MKNIDSYECVIIGGGIIGSSCFFQLASHGVNVLLIDSHRFGMGATGWSGAIVRVSHTDSQSIFKASIGRDMYRDMNHKYPELVPFTETGYLHFCEEEQLLSIKSNLSLANTNSVILNKNQINSLYPNLGIKVSSAIYEKESGYMNPCTTVNAFIKIGSLKGGDFFEGVKAINIEKKQGRVSGIKTSIGFIKSDSIIVAMGSGTADFLSDNSIATHSIHSKLIQVTRFKHDVKLKKAPCFIDDEFDLNGRYCPETKGLYIGHPLNLLKSGEVRSEALNLSHSLLTKKIGNDRFSWLNEAVFDGGLCHTDSYSDEKSGIVKELNLEGAFVAAGFCGGGFKMAPYVGLKILELITGKKDSRLEEF